ncbi:hypothetical protein [Mumia sp. DW29H23]|uniref:hypothetical protein n=1 Tax=Mumia sp. DW29H23 TaxID=3421241 RepID=UPI003D69F8EE
MRARPVLVTAAATVGVAVIGASTAVATDGVRVSAGSAGVKVCLTKKNVVVGASAKSRCPKGAKKKRVAVRGPQGARGATGARGPAGTATAYGFVSASGALVSGSPNVLAARPTGVAGGAYCVTFRTPIAQSRLVSAVVTSADRTVVAINPDRSTSRISCDPGELVVWTYAIGTATTLQPAPFQFLVP